MPVAPISVLETSIFERQAAKIWSEAEWEALIDYLAFNPEAGAIIPGTGGVRKLRWGRMDIGKQGGSRKIYFFYHEDAPLYMMFAYAKSGQQDLNGQQKRAMVDFAAIVSNAHPPKRNAQ